MTYPATKLDRAVDAAIARENARYLASDEAKQALAEHTADVARWRAENARREEEQA